MNFHPYKQLSYGLGMLLTACIISSCSEMDDTYDDFIKDGEIVYVQGADSLTLRPGNKRIQLNWLALSDPTVKRAMIYWDNRRDSLEVPIHKTQEIDTIQVMIDNLDERIYTFEIITFDDQGNRSVPTFGTGESFGDEYQNTLLPRLIISAEYYSENDSLGIIWGATDATAIGIELHYIDTTGHSRIWVDSTRYADTDTTWVGDLDPEAEQAAFFRSIYVPHPLAIDTFYTEPQSINALIPYDRSNWTATASSYDSRNGRTDRMPGAALDDDISSIWVNLVGSTDFPHWLAVDMGEVKTGTAGFWLGFENSRNEVPKLVDAYVSNDGLTWTFVEQYNVANAGGIQRFEFPEPQDCRYIKVDCLEPSGDQANVVIGEIGAYKR